MPISSPIFLSYLIIICLCRYSIVQNLTNSDLISGVALSNDRNLLFLKSGWSGFIVCVLSNGSYKLNQTVYRRVTDDQLLTTANGSTVAIGSEIYMLNGSNYTQLQTLDEVDGTAISADGLVYAGFLERVMMVWGRPDCFSAFTLFQNVTLPKYITSIAVSTNGSMIAVTTITTVFVYQRVGVYKQMMMFPTGLNPEEVDYPSVTALGDFSTLFVSSSSSRNYTVNIFRLKSGDYTLSQTLRKDGALIYGLAASEEALVLQELNLMRIFQFDSISYIELQNERQNYERVEVRNGTLIGSVARNAMVWRNGSGQRAGSEQ